LPIHYYLKSPGTNPVTITVTDKAGQMLATLTGPANQGLNRVYWNLTRSDATPMEPGEVHIALKAGDVEVKRPMAITVQAAAVETGNQK
jgi:hypothetical protein